MTSTNDGSFKTLVPKLTEDFFQNKKVRRTDVLKYNPPMSLGLSENKIVDLFFPGPSKTIIMKPLQQLIHHCGHLTFVEKQRKMGSPENPICATHIRFSHCGDPLVLVLRLTHIVCIFRSQFLI